MARQRTVIDFSDATRRTKFLAYFSACRDVMEFEWGPYKPRRSLRANAFYWAAVVPAFQAFMRAHGQFFADEEVHEFLLGTIAGKPVVDPLTGEVLKVVGTRSSKMNTAQFAEYVNGCMGWMLDRWGVEVPPPELAEPAPKRLPAKRVKALPAPTPALAGPA